MATKTGTTTKKTTRAKAAVKQAEPVVEAPVVETPKRKIDLHDYVQVRNGFHGKLVYKSRKTGEIYTWEEFGDTLDVEFIELRDAKVSNKKLFTNNFFIIEDEDVLRELGVKMFYNNVLPIDEFDEIFTLPCDELEEVLNGLSEGQRASVSYRARTLIEAKEIDSIKTIETLEKALKTKYLERD